MKITKSAFLTAWSYREMEVYFAGNMRRDVGRTVSRGKGEREEKARGESQLPTPGLDNSAKSKVEREE